MENIINTAFPGLGTPIVHELDWLDKMSNKLNELVPSAKEKQENSREAKYLRDIKLSDGLWQDVYDHSTDAYKVRLDKARKDQQGNSNKGGGLDNANTSTVVYNPYEDEETSGSTPTSNKSGSNKPPSSSKLVNEATDNILGIAEYGNKRLVQYIRKARKLKQGWNPLGDAEFWDLVRQSIRQEKN